MKSLFQVRFVAACVLATATCLHISSFAFLVLSCLATLSAGAVEWSMLVEADGVTNKITSADKRYAIDVSFAERDGAWSGSIANREKDAIVLGFEVMAEPIEVTPGKSVLYLPHVYGRRIRNWPVHGVEQKGVAMWRETAKCVFVPSMSKWDAATGSRAVPCRCRTPPSSPRCSGLRSAKGRAGSILPRRILWRARRISRSNTIQTARS